MNADGSGQTRLTNSSDWEVQADWQPLAAPSPSDFKNAAQFCKAERARLGPDGFKVAYGTHGNCVNQSKRT
jgi:hypothetical protein